MAITKLSHVKERKSGNPNAGLYNCIDYILNPDKTEERYIGGNAGSTTQEVYNRMMATKQEFRKLDGRQCYHFIISFAPGETDAITCFNIAQDFCEKYLAGRGVIANVVRHGDGQRPGVLSPNPADVDALWTGHGDSVSDGVFAEVFLIIPVSDLFTS